MKYNKFFEAVAYMKCAKCRLERNVERADKLCHILSLGGFFLGVVDMLILSIVREYIGNNWIAFIIFCICLGGICGFILAKLYCYVTREINTRFYQENWDIRILTDKIEEMQNSIEEDEDYDLVGEKDEQGKNS